MTARDTKLLKDISDYRFLSADQIKALHFDSAKSASERVRKLVNAGILVKLYAPIQITSRVMTKAFALTKKGANLLGMKTGNAGKHLPVRDRRSSIFLHHTLKRSAVRVVLELLARKGAFQFGWQQDEADVAVHAPRNKSAVPDGVVNIWHDGGCERLIIEVDRGTVRPKAMVKRYSIYSKYGFEQLGGEGLKVRVLTIVPNGPRLKRLQEAAVEASKGGTESEFLFATYDDAIDLDEPEKLLGPVWRTSADPQYTSLFTSHGT